MSFDVSGLNELVADLREAPIRAQLRAGKAVKEAVERGATDARRLAPSRGLQHYAATITAEVKATPQGAEGEFGPEKGGQGSLGHILEMGTASSPPHAHLGPALDLEGPRFVKAMEDLVDL